GIGHAQIATRVVESVEHLRDSANRTVPLSESGLLRADMERNAVRIKPGLASLAQQFDRHLGGAAELSRERPFSAVAGDEDAAEDARARGGTRQFFELMSAVEGKQPHPGLIGVADVSFFLDRVAERQP